MSIFELNKSATDQDAASKIRRVLIVEDDLSAIAYWSELFSLVDPSTVVESASNEDVARHKIWRSIADGNKFDLILTDIFLSSQRNGLDLWRNFHSEFEG